jgi:hypothetical protein
MKNILSIGCALLILSACQKNMNNNLPNPVKEVNKNTRASSFVYGITGGYNTPATLYQVSTSGIAQSNALMQPLGTVKFGNGTGVVPNVTGLAYRAGIGYVLFRSAANADWQIASFPINSPGSAAIHSTLINTVAFNELCDLDIQRTNQGTRFVMLDRSNAATNSYRIRWTPFAAGTLNFNPGPIITSTSFIPVHDIQGICTWAGNLMVLDKETNSNSNTDAMVIRRLDPLTYQELGNEQLLVNNIGYNSPVNANTYAITHDQIAANIEEIYVTFDNHVTIDNLSNLWQGAGTPINPNGMLSNSYPYTPAPIIDMATAN